MKKYLLIISMFLFFLKNFGQDAGTEIVNRTISSLKIESPNEASFNKFIDNPINIYSGTPDINIPIYTLREGMIEIPISIRYNSSGIKVDEEASWIGLGWNLNVGGVISRNVIGQIDKKQSASLEKHYTNVLNVLNNDFFKIDNLVQGPWALEVRNAFDWYLREPSERLVLDEGRYKPDIFYYSYPGGAGKFIVDFRDDTAYILDRNDNTKIEVYIGTANKLQSFKITTPNGIVHHFDLLGSTLLSDPVVPRGTTSETFILTKSVYPNGQTVNYYYDSVSYKRYNASTVIQATEPESTKVIIEASNPSKPELLKTLSKSTGLEFYLTKIETTNNLITFETSSRFDLNSGKKLDKIKVCSKNTPTISIFEYKFNYDYLQADAGVIDNNYWSKDFFNDIPNHQTSDLFLKRLRLLSFSYLDKKSHPVQTYTFFYNSKKLPRKDSFAKDYWGYNNSQGQNTSMIPDLDNLMWHEYGLLYHKRYKKLAKPTVYGGSFSYALRASDFESSKSGILEGIQYPTGGYTEFIYEPNTFIDNKIPTLEEVKKGFTTTKISIYDDNSFFAPDDLYPSNKNKYFILDKETTMSISISLTRGYPNRTKLTWSDMSEFKAYFQMGPTKIDLSEDLKQLCYKQHIQEVNYSAAKIDNLSIVKEVTLNKGGGYIIVDLPDRFGVQNGGEGKIQLSVEYSYPMKDKEESTGAGLRIKEINFYNSPNKSELLKYMHYTYTDPATGKSSGILHNKLQFAKRYPSTYDFLGRCNYSGPEESFSILSDKIEISGDNLLSNPYGSMPNVGYTFVKEVNKDISTGYIIHKFNNEEPEYKEHSIRLDNPVNGKESEVQYYNSSGVLLRKESYNYLKKIEHYHFGLDFYDRINCFPLIYKNSGWVVRRMRKDLATPPCALTVNDSIQEYWYMRYDRLQMIQHPVNSYFVYLKDKTTTIDGLTTKEEYSYSDKYQLKEKKITESTGKDVLFKYMYPNDFNCGIYLNMSNKNMISDIIEEKVFRNNKYLGGRFIEYNYFKTDKIIFPSKIYLSEYSGDQNDPVTFNCPNVIKDIYPFQNLIYKEYNSFGNPTHIVNNESLDIVYLWSYGGQYPIAKIENIISYSSVESAVASVFGVTGIDALSALTKIDKVKLNSLRSHSNLTNSFVTTYVYEPLVGMLESTDPSGITTYYEYDTFNRLKRTYIKEKNTSGVEVEKTIQNYEYNYLNK